MSGPYTRVTLLGARRHVDLLLPSTAATGTLMPQLLDLLGDEPGERLAAKVLLDPAGEPIPAQASLAEAGVADGARLTLLSSHEAPPPAVVYDLADAVVEGTGRVPGLWTRRHLVAASGVFSGAAFLAGLDLLVARSLPASAWWALPAVGALLLGLGAALGRASRPVAATLAGTGFAAAVLGVLRWDAEAGWRALAAAAAAVALLAVLGAVADRPRGPLTGAAVAAALAAAWAAAVPLAAWASSGAADAAGVGGFAAVATVLLLGALPPLALSASGLATLDDSRAKGGSSLRTDAVAALQAAHGGLTLAVVAAAASVGVALWLVGAGTAHPEWSLPLLLALALATMLRARSFPLAVQRHALFAAAAAGAWSGLRTVVALHPGLAWVVAAGLLALALCLGLGLAVRLPDHTQARMRQVSERLETLAVLATVPLLIGHYGVFARLLESF